MTRAGSPSISNSSSSSSGSRCCGSSSTTSTNSFSSSPDATLLQYQQHLASSGAELGAEVSAELPAFRRRVCSATSDTAAESNAQSPVEVEGEKMQRKNKESDALESEAAQHHYKESSNKHNKDKPSDKTFSEMKTAGTNKANSSTRRLTPNTERAKQAEDMMMKTENCCFPSKLDVFDPNSDIAKSPYRGFAILLCTPNAFNQYVYICIYIYMCVYVYIYVYSLPLLMSFLLTLYRHLSYFAAL